MENIINAIEFRLEALRKVQDIIKTSPESFPTVMLENEARIDELESLLGYIKMGIK